MKNFPPTKWRKDGIGARKEEESEKGKECIGLSLKDILLKFTSKEKCCFENKAKKTHGGPFPYSLL